MKIKIKISKSVIIAIVIAITYPFIGSLASSKLYYNTPSVTPSVVK